MSQKSGLTRPDKVIVVAAAKVIVADHGVNIRKIQLLLGHRSLRSTQIYTHVARDYLEDTPSPLDILPDVSSATSEKN